MKTAGRPKLGVVGREVTLLPRHWEWLNSRPGGASVALRKLVEQARKESEAADKVRLAQESAYHVMTEAGGDLPGYEEALRALFARQEEKFRAQIAGWPDDLRMETLRRASDVWLSVSDPA
ncbi:MAG: DUF2239 family protein [Acidobacteria bacterium]|nr:DUF2239 family protein [Acidobacteriota bacterium]